MFSAFSAKRSHIIHTQHLMVESEDFFLCFLLVSKPVWGYAFPLSPKRFCSLSYYRDTQLHTLLEGLGNEGFCLEAFGSTHTKKNQISKILFNTSSLKQLNCKYKQTNIDRDNQIKVLGVSRKKRYSLYESLLWFTTLVALIRSKLQ